METYLSQLFIEPFFKKKVVGVGLSTKVRNGLHKYVLPESAIGTIADSASYIFLKYVALHITLHTFQFIKGIHFLSTNHSKFDCPT